MTSRPTMLAKTAAAAALLIAASAHTHALASPQINELFRAGDTVLSTQGNPYDSILVGIPSIRNGLIAFLVQFDTAPQPDVAALITNRSGAFAAEWSSPEDGSRSIRIDVGAQGSAPTIGHDDRIAWRQAAATPPSNTFIQEVGMVLPDSSFQTIMRSDLESAILNAGLTPASARPSPPRYLIDSLTLGAGIAFEYLTLHSVFTAFPADMAPVQTIASAGQNPEGTESEIFSLLPLPDSSLTNQHYVAPYHAVYADRILMPIRIIQPPSTSSLSCLARIENGITTILHSQGDPIPGTDRFFASFNASKLAMRGEDYVFTAIDSEGENALYGVIEGEFRTIVDASTPIPGGLYGEPATFGQHNGPSFGGIAMNDGFIVFTASPRRTAGPFDNGIFAYDGDSLHKVLYAFEETLPGGHRFESAAFGPEALDDNNTIVFKAYTYDENNALGYGIYSLQLDITPAPCPGDITGNGLVGLDDFAILAANFGAGPGATREQGDLNGDGFVDLADFTILAVNFGNDCD